MSRPPPPAVEIVTIGDELLLGDTLDGNAAWLGRRLAAAGVRTARRTTVGDAAADIHAAVAAALERTGVVVCTGGLGPTPDDLTRPVVADLFGRALAEDDALLAALRERFDARGIRMAENNRRQAEVPEGATVFPNPRGTAPGLLLEDDRGVVVLLPGVPAEMRALVDAYVLDALLERFEEHGAPILSRRLRTTGIAESSLAAKVEDVLPELAPLGVAFLPSLDGVDLRVTSWGTLPEPDATAALDRAEALLRERAGRYVYAVGDDSLGAVVGRRLARRGLTLALAESCTGGLIGARLTDSPGASDFLLGGVISYSNEAKRSLLGVRAGTLAAHGAVSEEAAREMVAGVRETLGADVGLAVTGIAGPGGGSEAKPVGTVWIAAALPAARDDVGAPDGGPEPDAHGSGRRSHDRPFRLGESRGVARHLRLPGDRLEVRARAAQAALALLLDLLREEAP